MLLPLYLVVLYFSHVAAIVFAHVLHGTYNYQINTITFIEANQAFLLFNQSHMLYLLLL